VPRDVTRYCDRAVKLNKTENFKVLSIMLLQNPCWSFMQPDAKSKILYIYISHFFPLLPLVVPFYS
jgi:hypothetical protein